MKNYFFNFYFSAKIKMKTEKFDDMNLPELLLRGIYSYGFESPSNIQQQAIVPLIEGKDIIAQAQSGTGKTGAFSIGLLGRINPENPTCQGLIIAPTRELADQIKNVITEIGNLSQIKCHICIGGTNWRDDVEALKKGVQIVIGTPGRIYDMLCRKAIDGRDIECLILDEADEMLNLEGFQDLIYDIFQKLNKNVQIGLFSATMPPELLKLTQKFMKDPHEIIVKAENLSLDGISQYCVNVRTNENKFKILCDLYNDISITSSIIFCNNKRNVEFLSKEMMRNDFTVSIIHGSLDQNVRKKIMQDFRSGKSRVLITTDILARGIDVQHVSIVINYDLPNNLENYLHRIGRSGRFGRKGIAINFITNQDVETLKNIEKHYNIEIKDTNIDQLSNNIKEAI
jgi:translation initiation factor 4A